MAEGPGAPINHFVQEAFLVHTRNLGEFFREGARTFEANQPPPEREQNKILAVDFCSSVSWRPQLFTESSKLISAINQSLSHMTYHRDRAAKGHAHFEGSLHVHGTVELMRRTWGEFMQCVKPEFLHPHYREDINYWLVEHTKEWRVPFNRLENRFEEAVKRWPHWILNRTAEDH